MNAAQSAAATAGEMMEQLRRRVPQFMDTAELAAAAAIVVLAFVIGHFIGRAIGKRITVFLGLQSADEMPRYQHVLRASSSIVRALVSAILLAVARYGWNWQLYSEIIVGAGMAIAVAIATQALLRALNIGFWTAIAASAALFSILFSATVGGVMPVSNLLDQASFQMGTHRFSLLTLVSAVLIGIFLVAGVRLANNAVKLVLDRNNKLDGGQRLLGEKLALVIRYHRCVFYRHRFAWHRLDGVCGVFWRIRSGDWFWIAENLWQFNRGNYPADGPFDQAGRCYRGWR